MSHRFTRPLAAIAILMEAFAFLLPAHAAGGLEWQSTATGSTAQASVFSDVPGNSVSAEAIRSLKDQKVIAGYGDGSFRPELKINRAEFMKIVVESLGRPFEKKTNCFPDVKEEWFATYVCTGKAEGWIGGYPDGNFRPSENISFVEAAKIVGRAYGRAGGSGEPWYEPYVRTLEAGKAIPLTITDFDQKITRAQMSEIIYRIKSNVTTHASRTYAELKGEGTISGLSCQEVLERTQLPQILTLQGNAVTPSEAAMPQGDLGGGGKGGGGGYSPSSPFTTTNVQVPGVDEGDIVKTDGSYIYVAKADTIRIVQAVPPASLKEIATVRLPVNPNSGSFSVAELYATDKQLIAIGNDYSFPSEPVEGQKIIPPWQYNSMIRVLVFDTTNKAVPKLTRSVSVKGNFSNSRRIGDTLYLVNAIWSYGPYGVNYAAGTSLPGGDTSAVQGSAVLNVNATEKDVIPTIMDSVDGVTKPIVNCKDVLLFPKIPSSSYLTVSAIPLSDLAKPVKSKMVVADANATYVSAQNLYLTSTDWSQVRGDIKSSEKTSVYKFALSDAGATFVGNGSVTGSVLNQWSLDEYQGNLRIATTKHPEGGSNHGLSTAVSVFGPKMELLGRTQNLAPGEQAYAVLFMGNKGIVATYKQVDPLFVLDLSNPKNPQVKGALKIPGQPQYALEWDDNHVITFGNDDTFPVPEGPLDGPLPTPAPNVGGVKVALYDVSDLSEPKEVQHVVIGQSGSSTDAAWNHKAVMVDRERGLLAFPVTESAWTTLQTTQDKCTTYAYDQCPIDKCQKVCVPSSCTTENGVQVCTPDCSGAGSCKSWNYIADPSTGATYQTVWQGAYVYDVAKTGLILKGKVTHFTDADRDPVNGQTQWWGNKAIQRVLRIGDNLYTVSLGMVKALSLPGVTEVKSAVIIGD